MDSEHGTKAEDKWASAAKYTTEELAAELRKAADAINLWLPGISLDDLAAGSIRREEYVCRVAADRLEELTAKPKTMEVKCLEVRDSGTFLPVICIRPLPDNEEQRYLLSRDGYSCDPNDPIVIMIDAQCRGVAYDAYDWPGGTRTKQVAHDHIAKNWSTLKDGDVVDVEFILGLTAAPKRSERVTVPL